MSVRSACVIRGRTRLETNRGFRYLEDCTTQLHIVSSIRIGRTASICSRMPLLRGSSYAAIPFGPAAVSSASTSIGLASSPLSLVTAEILLALVFGGIAVNLKSEKMKAPHVS